MKSEVLFEVDSDAEKISNRVVAGMIKMGYRQIGGDPLTFRRGSVWGILLSIVPSGWATTVIIRLKQSMNGTTEVGVSFVVSYAIDSELLSPMNHRFWAAEMEQIKAIAMGDRPVQLASFQTFRTESERRVLAAWLMMLVVCATGTLVLGLATVQFGLIANLMMQMSTVFFGGLFVFVLIVFLNSRRRTS